MGKSKGRRNKKDKASKLVPTIPAIIYRAPVDRTIPDTLPLIIPLDAFKVIANFMLQSLPQARNVFLSMNEYRMRDLNPFYEETREGPTHMVMFCLRLLVSDYFFPLGVIQFDHRRDLKHQTEKLVYSWRAFIHDLSILRLVVVGSISPATKIFHRMLSELTENPNMENYTGPIVYSAWPYNEIVHLYCYNSLMCQLQDAIYAHDKICFMTCTPTDEIPCMLQPCSLQLWTASWTDILITLAAQDVRCYYTSEEPDTLPIAIFSSGFWALYQQAITDGQVETDTRESTDRLMDLICNYASSLRELHEPGKSFMCPYDLQMLYDDNEELRILLATAKFKKILVYDADKFSPNFVIVVPKKPNNRNSVCLSKVDLSIPKDFGSNSEDITASQMNTDSSMDKKGPFDIFLKRMAYDDYELFLKTTPKERSCTPNPDEPNSKGPCCTPNPDEPNSKGTYCTPKPNEPNSTNKADVVLLDHSYSKVEHTEDMSAQNSVIYNVVKEYFVNALKEHPNMFRKVSSSGENDVKITIHFSNGKSETENKLDGTSSVETVKSVPNNPDNKFKIPLEQPNISVDNSENLRIIRFSLDPATIRQAFLNESQGIDYQFKTSINTTDSNDKSKNVRDTPPKKSTTEKKDVTREDKTSKVNESIIDRVLQSPRSRSSKKIKNKRLRYKNRAEKFVESVPILHNSPKRDGPVRTSNEEKVNNYSASSIESTCSENKVDGEEVEVSKDIAATSNIPDSKKTDNNVSDKEVQKKNVFKQTDENTSDHFVAEAANDKKRFKGPPTKRNEYLSKIEITGNGSDEINSDNSCNRMSENQKNDKPASPDNLSKSIPDSAIPDFRNIPTSCHEVMNIPHNNEGTPLTHLISDEEENINRQICYSHSTDSLTELLNSMEADPSSAKVPCKFTIPKKLHTSPNMDYWSEIKDSENDFVETSTDCFTSELPNDWRTDIVSENLLQTQTAELGQPKLESDTNTKRNNLSAASKNPILKEEHGVPNKNASPSLSFSDSLEVVSDTDESLTNFEASTIQQKNINKMFSSTKECFKSFGKEVAQSDLIELDSAVVPSVCEDPMPDKAVVPSVGEDSMPNLEEDIFGESNLNHSGEYLKSELNTERMFASEMNYLNDQDISMVSDRSYEAKEHNETFMETNVWMNNGNSWGTVIQNTMKQQNDSNLMPCCMVPSTSFHKHNPSGEINNQAVLPYYTRFKISPRSKQQRDGESNSSSLAVSPVGPRELYKSDKPNNFGMPFDSGTTDETTGVLDLLVNKFNSIYNTNKNTSNNGNYGFGECFKFSESDGAKLKERSRSNSNVGNFNSAHSISQGIPKEPANNSNSGVFQVDSLNVAVDDDFVNDATVPDLDFEPSNNYYEATDFAEYYQSVENISVVNNPNDFMILDEYQPEKPNKYKEHKSQCDTGATDKSNVKILDEVKPECSDDYMEYEECNKSSGTCDGQKSKCDIIDTEKSNGKILDEMKPEELHANMKYNECWESLGSCDNKPECDTTSSDKSNVKIQDEFKSEEPQDDNECKPFSTNDQKSECNSVYSDETSNAKITNESEQAEHSFVEYHDYKMSLCSDNQESQCNAVYKDKDNYEKLYNQIPKDFETLRLTTDWTCTFKGYLKLKELLLGRKVRQFQASILTVEHTNFFIHLINKVKYKIFVAYTGPSYKFLDYRAAFDVLNLGKGVYIVTNDDNNDDLNNMSL